MQSGRIGFPESHFSAGMLHEQVFGLRGEDITARVFAFHGVLKLSMWAQTATLRCPRRILASGDFKCTCYVHDRRFGLGIRCTLSTVGLKTLRAVQSMYYSPLKTSPDCTSRPVSSFHKFSVHHSIHSPCEPSCHTSESGKYAEWNANRQICAREGQGTAMGFRRRFKQLLRPLFPVSAT
jgi:hypothetical protein